MTDQHKLLYRVAGTLYGDRWQSALARELGVAVRTVQRWHARHSPIPDGIWPELDQLLARRTEDIRELRICLKTIL